jgi:hypothetical protein
MEDVDEDPILGQLVPVASIDVDDAHVGGVA